MLNSVLRAGVAGILSLATAMAGFADPIPEGYRAENVEVVGYVDAAGSSPFKMSLLQDGDTWYMYASNLFHRGWSILDVTDPEDPKVLKFIEGPENTGTWQVDIADGLMITALDALSANWGGDPDAPHAPEAVLIWSLEDPLNPKQIGSFTTGGGTHRNGYFGGRYMHLAANHPDYRGEMYMIVDIGDPSNPVEAGRYQPGGLLQSEPGPYDRARLHGPADVRGDLAFLPFGGAGFIIADISDPANIEEIGRLDFTPLFGPTHLGVHTTTPYLERNLAIVNGEAIAEECQEALNFAGLVDISDMSQPRLLSQFPLPQPPEGEPLDPRERRGPLPRGALALQSEDVLVDTRGNIFVSHKNQGIWVLRYTGGQRTSNRGKSSTA